MPVRNKVLANIQTVEDDIINRFCAVSRRLERKMDWVTDETPFSSMEKEILEQIIFYEARGFYLFLEPWLEHEPFNHRYRVVLTFRPTEANR